MQKPELSRVSDVMEREVPILESDATLDEALGMMAQARAAEVLVTRDGQLEGLLTEHAAREWAPLGLRARPALASHVHMVMLRKPLAIGPEAEVTEALDLMIEARLQLIPVVDADRHPLGVVRLYDVSRLLRGQGTGAPADDT